MSWTPFLITAAIVILLAIFFVAVRFFRKVYFMIEEIDARLIQLRNLIETGSASGKSAQPKKGPPKDSPPPASSSYAR